VRDRHKQPQLNVRVSPDGHRAIATLQYSDTDWFGRSQSYIVEQLLLREAKNTKSPTTKGEV
jgi:hypothetical protein